MTEVGFLFNKYVLAETAFILKRLRTNNTNDHEHF
jgi:hypothetical protein